MKKYVLKSGGFYLGKFSINVENYETEFLDTLIFTTNKENALELDITNAERFAKMLYIEAGIDFDIREV